MGGGHYCLFHSHSLENLVLYAPRNAKRNDTDVCSLIIGSYILDEPSNLYAANILQIAHFGMGITAHNIELGLGEFFFELKEDLIRKPDNPLDIGIVIHSAGEEQNRTFLLEASAFLEFIEFGKRFVCFDGVRPAGTKIVVVNAIWYYLHFLGMGEQS